MGCVYLLECIPTGKGYVGFTKHTAEIRWDRHCKEAAIFTAALHAAIRKYGKEQFIVSTIVYADTREELTLLEIFCIAFLGTKAPNGYNLTSGGEGAPDLPPEIEAIRIAKGAATRTGRPLSLSHCKNLSISHTGKPHPSKGTKRSPEACENYRKGAIARWADPGKAAAAHKAIQSPEAVAKRVAALTGKKHPPERVAKQSKSQTKRWSDPEECKKQSDRLKAYNQRKRDGEKE